MITFSPMKAARTTVHIAKPAPEEYTLLRLLSPEEKLAAMVAAARAKAARIGGIDSDRDSGKEGLTGTESAD